MSPSDPPERMGLRHRMYAQFVAAVAPLVCLLLFQLLSVSDVPDRLDRALDRYRASNDAVGSYREFLNGVTDALDTGNVAESALYALAQARSAAAKVQGHAGSPQLAAALTDLDAIGLALRRANSLQTLLPLRPDINRVHAALRTAAEDSERYLAQLVAQDSAAETEKNKILVGIAALTLVLLAFMLRELINRITVPIEWAVATAGRIASGDLSEIVAPNKRYDGISELQAALRTMAASLTAIVTHVREGSDLISVASEKLSRDHAELWTRTLEQAASLHATAESLEWLTLCVQRNAEHAHRADALARSAAEVASKGGEMLRQLTQKMSLTDVQPRDALQIAGIGDTMQHIVGTVRDVAQLMREIAATSEEQTSGIEHVHRALAELSLVAARNAAVVEEARGAAVDMRDQAVQLEQVVGLFEIGEGGWLESRSEHSFLDATDEADDGAQAELDLGPTPPPKRGE